MLEKKSSHLVCGTLFRKMYRMISWPDRFSGWAHVTLGRQVRLGPGRKEGLRVRRSQRICKIACKFVREPREASKISSTSPFTLFLDGLSHSLNAVCP